MAWTKRRKLQIGAVVSLVGAGVLAAAAVVRHLAPSAGSFDRRRFEAIVAEVRSRPIKAGDHVRFRLGDAAAPGALRRIRDDEPLVRGEGAGLVWAERTKSDQLKVVIETRDAGHAGEYGFAFSEVPLVPTPLAQHWSTVDLPGRLTIVEATSQIDARWWAVLNNLD